MSLLIYILITLLLIVVVYQDFKNKEINWWLIPLLFIVFGVKGLLQLNMADILTYFSINLIIVTINLIGITAIISLKEKRIVNIFDTYLGWGDVLFFLVLTVVFSPINFVLFFLGSILLISIIYGVIILINKQTNTLIPLAGGMSVFLILTLVTEHLLPTYNNYNDIILIGE